MFYQNLPRLKYLQHDHCFFHRHYKPLLTLLLFAHCKEFYYCCVKITKVIQLISRFCPDTKCPKRHLYSHLQPITEQLMSCPHTCHIDMPAEDICILITNRRDVSTDMRLQKMLMQFKKKAMV